MGKGLIAAAIVAALCGCTTAKGGFCEVSSPLRLSGRAVDTLSDQEARALLAHNRKGEKLCGWRP
ncbi:MULTISPECIES: hypothetical protein [unclassified Mesorhizobium]|uniref:hypothetical protein n=1 Tax=unclassified Mesorhizobium TaxID=325217 RepID=UPI000FCB2DFE|nr:MULTISPECIES: hypothetical protein [unclassified Mesorhizobium]TIT71918.1 MAG: hypothetical protein E5W57_30730 [Mesorhizobium sp.]TGP27241.1 hypothetical protein EN874_006355 [Mesorhizobium sp. M1D.F.Ca.ET.231.01.1.1]TGP39199.1 hypothetical protein EN877_06355 [Mesorhizobium sp. M1D.F.Ca.ET.234.01.1.1]TGS51408.1 hypothetical protein EN827_06355 [Mesorhizobium sp. M1D.F.Ca.ET.184.01.1.1]TGS67292.1 hypothetical protein EN826_006355 [Mesorhizobium sp. M1D.F.Ca.ET.183.01.1.1]